MIIQCNCDCSNVIGCLYEWIFNICGLQYNAVVVNIVEF